MEEADENELILSLGDVVEIVSPEDKTMDGLKFLITYIDSSLIEMISATRNKIEIKINEDNSLSNKNITEINIIARDSNKGYARQNQLIPKKWVDIYFKVKGNDLTIITANIIGIQEDQIELKTTDGDVIYIDFSYKGLPKNIPITKIVIRDAPPMVSSKSQDKGLGSVIVEEGEESEKKYPDDANSILVNTNPLSDAVSNQDDEFMEIAKEEQEMKNGEDGMEYGIEFQDDDIVFGDNLDAIQMLVDVPESEQRFTMESQIEDLINSMISSLNPELAQTKQQMNQIRTISERYKELRDDTGIRVDASGKPIKKGRDYKPIIDSLKQMNKKLYWILPVVKNIKKLYDLDDEEVDQTGARLYKTRETVEEESKIYSDFISNSNSEDISKYNVLVKRMDPYLKPFLDPSQQNDDQGLYSVTIKDNITAIVDNLGSFDSNVVLVEDKNYIRTKKFLIQEYNLGLNTIEINKTKGGLDKSTSSSVIVKIKPITEADKMTITSMVTLPTPVLEFSHINLPTTSILNRANLTQNFISLWRVLNEKTSIKPSPPQDSDIFFKDTRVWEMKKDEDNDPDFEDFLNTIIPTSSSLFNITKDKNPTNLSIVNMIEKLEPFLIYLKDISITQYSEMVKHIEEKIEEFENKMNEKRSEYEKLDLTYDDVNGKRQDILEFFGEELIKSYECEPNISDGEFLQHCNKIDNGRYLNVFFSQIRGGVSSLISDEGVENILKDLEEKKDEELNESEAESNFEQRLDSMKNAFKSRQLSEKSRLKTILENRKRSENMFSIQFNVENKGPDLEPNGINAIISPIFEKLERLRDSIIGQKDERKRYMDILMFVKKYTKPLNNIDSNGTNDFWLYDIVTNQKIIPTFLVKIANAFINNNKNYEDVVEKLCGEQGARGQDGEAIVDKHSGYVIKIMNFDTDEGYTEDGYAKHTRSVLEKEIVPFTVGEAIEDAHIIVDNHDNDAKLNIGLVRSEIDKSFDVISNPLSKPIINVITAISANIGVYLNSETLEFVITQTTKTFNGFIITEDEYNKLMKNKKGKEGKEGKEKKFDSYQVDSNKKLIGLTLCYLLATIQTSIPPIKPSTNFPGCKKSFAGYPLGEKDDKDGMKYIACVAIKIKMNNEEPWKSIEKLNEAKLLDLMNRLMTMFVVKNNSIITRIKSKMAYDSLRNAYDDDDDGINEEINVKKWEGFLPNMSSIHITGEMIQPIQKVFYQTLDNHIEKGNILQEEKINTLYGKSIYHSLHIKNLIKTLILKTDFILKTKSNVPFLENSCCEKGQHINPLIYFIDKNPEIKTQLKLFVELNKIILKLKRDVLAPILFDPFDTKRKIVSALDIASGFTQETRYMALQHFCKYREKINLTSVYGEEENQICEGDNKDHGEFKEENFEKLMVAINNKNVIKINDEEKKYPKDDDIKGILDTLQPAQAQARAQARAQVQVQVQAQAQAQAQAIVPNEFTLLLSRLVNSNKTDDDKNLFNYIDKENIKLSTDLKNFLSDNSKKSKSESKQWNGEYFDGILLKIKDISFLKYSILALSTKFPNIIINDVLSINPQIPKHWGLSSLHETNLKKKIKDSTEPLNKINRANIDLLKNIQKKCSIFHSMSKATYIPQTIYNIKEKIYMFYLLNIIHIYIKTTKEGLQKEDSMKFKQSNEQSLNDCVLIIKKFVTILCDESKKVILTYTKLTDKINASKEKEKNKMTEKLSLLTPEQMAVEREFKMNKIGNWGVGLEKGFTNYDRDVYDTEMGDNDEEKAIMAILLAKGLDKKGHSVEALGEDEMKGQNDEEDMIDREELKGRGGENEQDDYEYEDDF